VPSWEWESFDRRRPIPRYRLVPLPVRPYIREAKHGGAKRMDVEAAIRDLQRRVGELEGSFEFLTKQVKAVHRDVLEFREAVEGRFDGLEGTMERRFDQVDHRLAALPEIITGAIGEALRSR
jgi:predicted  nucleic acid-binding Zn-ribbon protein